MYIPFMASKGKIIKAQQRKKEFLEAMAKGVKSPFSTKVRNRCAKCGRARGYLRHFDMCRICVREAMIRGDLNGFTGRN